MYIVHESERKFAFHTQSTMKLSCKLDGQVASKHHKFTDRIIMRSFFFVAWSVLPFGRERGHSNEWKVGDEAKFRRRKKRREKEGKKNGEEEGKVVDEKEMEEVNQKRRS
ncbi:hypothetical protein PRIPAC_76290 [Pristionchus pacificus]|uniref:Uncharacterized protein n=1 Tax=Pristionchus pacificus TaxID=54126 RepID=A0A2A6BFS8_PRIPA|nr:hypothetical protein PRIPAC_76290 [Pristionchus pacificus]|eukprot:PDM64661.1 hypothetical protein PRIPAC_52917 [Pristionchus pacificus]